MSERTPHFMSDSDSSQLLILYDGDCGFCSHSVRFLLGRDRDEIFRFARLQSEEGREVLRHHGLPEDFQGSMLLVDARRAYLRSDAVLYAAAMLPGLYRMAGLLLWIPRCVRDALYNLVARNRQHISRCLGGCPLPTPAERKRLGL